MFTTKKTKYTWCSKMAKQQSLNYNRMKRSNRIKGSKLKKLMRIHAWALDTLLKSGIIWYLSMIVLPSRSPMTRQTSSTGLKNLMSLSVLQLFMTTNTWRLLTATWGFDFMLWCKTAKNKFWTLFMKFLQISFHSFYTCPILPIIQSLVQKIYCCWMSEKELYPFSSTSKTIIQSNTNK